MVRQMKILLGRKVMSQEARSLAREGRSSNLHELDEVTGLPIGANQLPLTTLVSLKSEGSRSKESGIEFSMEITRDRVRVAEIEQLTNLMLCGSQTLN